MWNTFYYGVCYYPEHWDPKRHESDIARMAKAGFNLIRLGESAWSYWEPEEGKFQFDMFDRVIDLCKHHRLKVIMGTPTYCAPAWVMRKYPEVLRWNFERNPMSHGSRRNLTYSSPKYLELSDRICTALANHYKNEKQIIAWQLDNEFNCHMDVSYAPVDTMAFQQWLKRKYRTLDRLNDAWGTRFWSQTYDDWDQIDLPHPTSAPANPHQKLDESRFVSDMVMNFARRQAEILRGASRHWLITHNGVFGNVNPPDLARELDFFSHDQYPLFYGDWPGAAFRLIEARTLSFPYAILEQQAGPGGQVSYLLKTPRSGQLRLWAWQSIAHGAKLLSYFRWRSCPYGAEQHWHGLLDHDDRDSTRLAEAKQVGEEIRALPNDFYDAEPVRQFAVMRDFDNEVNENRVNTYNKSGAWEQGTWIAELSRKHFAVDMVWPASDLRGYKVLVAPHLRIIDRAMVRAYTDFVRRGGTLVLGAQSGLKDRNLHIIEQTPPGLLRALAGVEVEQWSTLSDDEQRDLRFLDERDGPAVPVTTFVERLRPRSAKPLARWTNQDPLLNGAPAITVNRVGKGQVIYIGGYLRATAIGMILDRLTRDLKLRPLLDAPNSVEVIARDGKSRRYFAVLNHSDAPQPISGLPSKCTESLTRQRTDTDPRILPPYGVAILSCPRKRG